MSSIPHKCCVNCGTDKPLTDYHRHSRTLDGYRTVCKVCRLADERARRLRWEAERSALPEYKVCSVCHVEQPTAAYNRHKGTRDGLHSECKACSAIQRRDLFLRNPDHARSLGRSANKRRYEKRREYNREWRRRNAAYVRSQYRVYRRKHKEKYRLLKRSWYRLHPEYEVRRSAIRRQRVASAEAHHTIAEWRELRKSFGNVCLRCGATDDLTLDHIVPLVLGGSNHISNLQLLCRVCNSWKNARIIDYR